MAPAQITAAPAFGAPMFAAAPAPEVHVDEDVTRDQETTSKRKGRKKGEDNNDKKSRSGKGKGEKRRAAPKNPVKTRILPAITVPVITRNNLAPKRLLPRKIARRMANPRWRGRRKRKLKPAVATGGVGAARVVMRKLSTRLSKLKGQRA